MLGAFDPDSGLQDLVDHSTSAIFVKDRDGRYVVVNEAFLAPFGLSRPDVVGRSAPEVWPGAVISDDRDERVLTDGVVETSDDLVELPDGAHTLMTVRFPLRDAAGHIDGMAAIATDVTDRKAVEEALRERERLLDTILRASPDIVTVLDERARVTAVSEASAAILGYDHSDPVHEQLEALVHPEDLPATHRAYRRLFKREVSSFEIRYRVRHADGHWVTLDARCQAIEDEDGRVKGAVAVARDVSDELRFEQDLQSALLAAQEASSAKSEFLSRMSHELRTPLNSVLGFAQLLDMEELSPQHTESVRHILQAGHHLVDLIDEVLDIARIETGHFELYLEPVSVEDVLQEAVDLTRPLSERRQVEITLRQWSADVLADRQRLLQVILNLLSNAVKYNFVGGRVDVSASAAGDSGGWIEIVVSDTGKGVGPEELERVFEPFERLGAERGSVEGTGMGLTLSKHLVERMGGRIELASEVNVGSTFKVTLPACRRGRSAMPVPVSVSSSAGAAAQPGLAEAPRRLVLYVEDNLDSLDLVEQVLRRVGGFELISATDGATALRMASEHDLDLVLLDLHLPDLAGTDVLARLRSGVRNPSVPVVVISADATAPSLERLAGAVMAYLTKPIDVRELLGVLERAGSADLEPT